MLKLKQINKEYKTGELVQHALNNVSLNLRDNEFVAILGPSGSGKTTLLNIIGGLDRYDSGDLIINGISTKKYTDRDWDSYRNHTIGFVFQSYNLIPHQTVLGNVELALTISGVSKAERRRRAAAALILYRCGGQLLIACGLLLRRGLRHQQRLNTARCGRLKPQLFKRVQISVIQLFPLTSLNNVAASPALNVHPYGVEAVEDTSDAPLVGSTLHAVGEAAFDGLNVRILSAVPFGNEALAFKVNGNAAELCILFSIGVPRLELVVPVFWAADTSSRFWMARLVT